MEQNVAHREARHLCVLVHGLWGSPVHMANVAKVLRARHPEETLHILNAKRNSGSFTYDGVELGGERVCEEIEEELDKLAREGHVITKLSIVGYSLGGLVGRYAVGLLYSRGVFEKIEPVNFTTFATPHLGVRTPLKGWHNHVWNILGARTLSMSGRQLFIIDKFRETDRPLLSVLADPSSIFIKGLAQFKRRTLYSNIINDRTAVYYTTGLSKVDPFVDLSKVTINYLKGYEDVLVDSSNPVTSAETVSDLPTFYSRLATRSQSFLNRLPFTLALLIFIPLGCLVLLVNTVVLFRSSRRIRLYESASYRIPLFITGVREAVEDVYGGVNSAQSHEYLASGVEEEILAEESASSPRRERPESPIASRTLFEDFSSEKAESEPVVVPPANVVDVGRSQSGHMDIPILALAPAQFAMLQALDTVGWRKYPVHIHKVRHSHAAIIVRMNRGGFSEGYVVLRHWVDKEFLIE